MLIKDLKTYEIAMEFDPHVATVHLGSQKYTTATRALGELVANSFDAGATRVSIHLETNQIGGVTSVIVQDDGIGISPEVLKSRFRLVGRNPIQAPGDTRLGRFGVGRLAVHRIGGLSKWSTVAIDTDGSRVASDFSLSSDEPNRFVVNEHRGTGFHPTGTRIEILNLLDSAHAALIPARVATDLLTQFCSYLLARPEHTIIVQGEALDVGRMIESEADETLLSDDLPAQVTLKHLLLRSPVDNSRFPAQLLFAGKGRTVHTCQPPAIPSSNYLGIAESEYFDAIVTSNRESIIEMDPGFQDILSQVIDRVAVYRDELRNRRSSRFIESARNTDFYPYRGAPDDSITHVKRELFDVALERVNEHANIERMTRTQQAVVFRLLKRALENENILDILSEVASLSDADVEKFRRVLERTTLNSIIRLSSEVTERLKFLDILHELVYGNVSKHLKERSQLHKILEPHGWIFGPQYHLATSDKGFREVVRRHRQEAGLAALPANELSGSGVVSDRIPDLFLCGQKEYPTDPKHHHLLVEIKAPKVTVSRKERDQIEDYANIILKSSEFDKRSVKWDLFIVSSKIHEDLNGMRTEPNRPYGAIFVRSNMTVYALEWCEIITSAREELKLVKDHLQEKSKELSVSEYLKENFPEILADLEHRGATLDHP